MNRLMFTVRFSVRPRRNLIDPGMRRDSYLALKMLQTQAIETNHGNAQTKAKLDLTFVTLH
jgi:hypothetical protein